MPQMTARYTAIGSNAQHLRENAHRIAEQAFPDAEQITLTILDMEEAGMTSNGAGAQNVVKWEASCVATATVPDKP